MVVGRPVALSCPLQRACAAVNVLWGFTLEWMLTGSCFCGPFYACASRDASMEHAAFVFAAPCCVDNGMLPGEPNIPPWLWTFTCPGLSCQAFSVLPVDGVHEKMGALEMPRIFLFI
eukprot:1139023-Pelagomonas_calceolata.AAC.1